MDDLVLIRQLLRGPMVKANQNRYLSFFHQLGFEVLFECVIARPAFPRDALAIAIALSLNSIGLKSINACDEIAKDY